MNRQLRRKLQAGARIKTREVAWQMKLTGKQEIYSNLEHDTGVFHVFAASEMRRFAEAYHDRCEGCRLHRIVLNQAYIDDILTNRGIERPRLDRMTPKYRDIPIICVKKENGATLIIDGNHRALKRWEEGMQDVSAYVFFFPFWKEFLLTDRLRPEVVAHLRKSVETESAIRDDCVSELKEIELKEICSIP